MSPRIGRNKKNVINKSGVVIAYRHDHVILVLDKISVLNNPSLVAKTSLIDYHLQWMTEAKFFTIGWSRISGFQILGLRPNTDTEADSARIAIAWFFSYLSIQF